jgi:hypothetical protein
METHFFLICLRNCPQGDTGHDIVACLVIVDATGIGRGETCTSDIQIPVSGVTLTKYTQNHSE